MGMQSREKLDINIFINHRLLRKESSACWPDLITGVDLQVFAK